jgi:thymidylate synthase
VIAVDAGVASDFQALYLKENLTIVNPHGSVGIVTLWSKTQTAIEAMRAAGIDLGETSSRIAVVANLYGDGLAKMLANLLYNPQIRRLVLWGKNLSDSKVSLEGFFGAGVVAIPGAADMVLVAGTSRKLPAVLNPSLFASPPDLVDFGDEVNAGKAAGLAPILDATPSGAAGERVAVEIPEPVVLFKPSAPYDHSVVADTPCEVWRELLFRLKEFGRSVAHETSGGDRMELLNVRAVVREPAEESDEVLRAHDLDPASLRAYQEEFNKPELPADLAYTYGSRLHSFFGVDAIDECRRILLAERGSRHAYISLWDTSSDLSRDTVPCMVSAFFRLYDEKLSLTATFRAHNAGTAWIRNVYGLLPILNGMAAALEVPAGPLIVISQSISLRKSELDKVASVIELYERKFVQYRPDPNGHFEISIGDGRIVAIQRFEGAVVNRFEGRSAQVLEHHIARACAVSELTHALYLGRELARAEECMKTGAPYVQK